MIFSVTTKLQSLLQNEKAAAIFEQFLPDFSDTVKSNPQAAQLSIEQLVHYARLPDGDRILARLDVALQKLNDTETFISAEEAALIATFRQISLRARETKPQKACHHQDAIYPGKPWLDTCGRRIQAHGGAVYFEDGVYYWYGENKEYTDGKNGVWTWGIRAYASTDLCNWEDKGLIIEPNIEDPNSSLFPAQYIDRPHILRCPQTGKYVCWIKLSGPQAAFTIWQSDQLLGPYEQVENLYQPGGIRVGDFDLVADEAADRGLLYAEVEHSAIVCLELSADYLHAERELARSYEGTHPPFTREAPCLFSAFGKKYMLTSGMTGYVPNQSDWAVATSWDQPFTSQGDPHAADETKASFNSQISKIFPVEGKENQFVAMADRWLPDYPVDARIADLFTRVIAVRYDPEHYQASEDERQEMYSANRLETANTCEADYVWLPVTVTPPDETNPFGCVSIEWRDAWTPDV